jgi:Fur family transcriptional regulator, iron response regulator
MVFRPLLAMASAMAELSHDSQREPEGSDREQQLGLILPAERNGRPPHRYKELLRRAGLRLTRQRIVLGRLLFAKGNRHVTAETLHHEAIEARIPVSLATVYNTLHQFTGAGLLREIAMAGSKTFFDTNRSEHHHFFVESEEAVIDIPPEAVAINSLPQAPAGFEVARVDVVVRLRRKGG